MVPAKSVLIDLRTGYVWQPIGSPSGSADRYRVPARRAEAAAPRMRNILRFIVCIISLDKRRKKTIAPAGRKTACGAASCSFDADREHLHHGRSVQRSRLILLILVLATAKFRGSLRGRIRPA